MRYFTPQLYQQFNSPDDEEADRANEAWEGAIQAYRQQLDRIRGAMPSQVVALSRLCLHDAELLARSEEIQASTPVLLADVRSDVLLPIWSAIAVVSVKLEGEILSLFYCLWDRLRTHPAPETWTFSKLREHWLYDEIDVASDRRPSAYVHRVLLSTGTVLEIPFSSVVIHRFAYPAAGEARTKQTA